jgi:hypothetical protein
MFTHRRTDILFLPGSSLHDAAKKVKAMKEMISAATQCVQTKEKSMRLVLDDDSCAPERTRLAFSHSFSSFPLSAFNCLQSHIVRQWQRSDHGNSAVVSDAKERRE